MAERGTGPGSTIDGVGAIRPLGRGSSGEEVDVRTVRTLVFAAGLALCGDASALPVPIVPATSAAVLDRVQLACGPYRCFRRPFWRYGDGRGFFPAPRFGSPPERRFGYRPFGFGRFGGFRGR